MIDLSACSAVAKNSRHFSFSTASSPTDQGQLLLYGQKGCSHFQQRVHQRSISGRQCCGQKGRSHFQRRVHQRLISVNRLLYGRKGNSHIQRQVHQELISVSRWRCGRKGSSHFQRRVQRLIISVNRGQFLFQRRVHQL